MNTFNWRVLSPNTLRAYTTAAKDFETVTGRFADQADQETIDLWRADMVGRKLSDATIRQRLHAIAFVSGIQVKLPKRPADGRTETLSADQVRKIMSVVTNHDDRLMLVKILTLGPQARTLSDRNTTFEAHFLGTAHVELSAAQVTRKIRRYAQKAGLDAGKVSLRVWYLTGRMLIQTLEPAELVALIDHSPNPSAGVSWKPLHGIGRRSAARA